MPGDSVVNRGRPGPGIGDRLPPLVLPRARDGVGVAWRAPQRGAPIVVFLADIDSGRQYVRELAEWEPRLRDWSGRPLVVLPAGPGGEVEGLEIRGREVELLVDPDGEAHRRCGVAEGEAVLFIADRWGQIYAVERASTEAGLPRVEEIEEWMRYLATQCPECGVPDEPGRGEWEAK